MSKEEFHISCENQVFLVRIIYKDKYQKGIYYRKINNVIEISAGSIRARKQIMENLPEVIKKLLKKSAKKKNEYFLENGIYLFGKFVPFVDDKIEVFGEKYIFLSKEQFYKRASLPFKKYLESRVKYFSKIMNVTKDYKVKTKLVKTLYGSNSIKTLSLTFNMILIHYSPEIIDSVVVHELAHDKKRNHSHLFYEEVLKTMPNYYYLDNKLKKGILE